ncbi:PilN domain-containing protein [Vibrio hepatarius]|uniref:PilN domain-containing protein n=1 Tax=Vibrio hepatarius TaxID=171383 RepID=UPI001C089EAC|nr:PilN domain-containing protein [Vibrio hepatarius]MBU2896958.1 PilN domain-containing protein [Vibrio hepatarius]
MSYNINLIPWREKRRGYQIRILISRLCVVTIVGALTCIYLAKYLASKVEKQQERVALLSERSQWIVEQKERGKLTQQNIEQIESAISTLIRFDVQRFRSLDLMLMLSETIPERVYLNQISLTGNQVQLKGITATSANLSELLTLLNQSPGANAVTVQQLRGNDSSTQHNYLFFTILFELVERIHE